MLLNLTGGVKLKQRVQHPSVIDSKDRGTYYWCFRYRDDEIPPDGVIKTRRKFHIVAPSRGDGALTKKQAGLERDKFLLERNGGASQFPIQHHVPTNIEVKEKREKEEEP